METPGGRFTSIFMDFDSFNFYYGFWLIHNANRTEWSPIRSVIIQVIDESNLLTRVSLQTEMDDMTQVLKVL